MVNQKVERLLNLITKVLVLATTFLIPFFMWNITTDGYETAKFLSVSLVTLILLIIWAVRFATTSKITLTKTPFDIPLILLLIVAAVSTIFSKTQATSLLGNLPRINGGFASLTLYVLYYFMLVAVLKHIDKLKQMSYILIGSGVVLAILSLLSYFGIYLPLVPKLLHFTPTGSPFSTTAFLVLVSPFALVAIFSSGNQGAKPIWAGILALFAVAITLTGSMSTYLAAFACLGLTLFVTPAGHIKKYAYYLLPSLLLTVLIGVFSFISLPQLSQSNFLYSQAQKFPRDAQLPFVTSWKISISAFRDSPFWGSGPATYLSDFTLYKPLDFNNTRFWNIRFDSAFNEYLQVLATLGVTGLLALLLLTAIFISSAFKALAHHDLPADSGNLPKAISISGVLFFVLLALHPSTLTVWLIGLTFLALFTTIQRKAIDLNVGMPISKNESVVSAFEAIPGIVLMVVLILVGFGLFFIGKFTLADYHHKQALNAVVANKGVDAYNQLVKAEQLNPYAERYRVDLAQTNFALANAIAASKPGSDLTDQDKLNIQNLLSQAINEGKAATTINPQNPGNWEVLGGIYRQIAGVAPNALQFSLDSYGRAIQRDPLNPVLRIAVGGIYYAARNYDLAARFFTDSINLKSDFSNGYYNLAVALRDKGDTQTAIVATEKVLSLVDKNSPDYTTASNLLKELQDKSATTSAEPPAAKTDSALADDKKKLPKVLDLPKPDKITTPSAVKASPSPNP